MASASFTPKEKFQLMAIIDAIPIEWRHHLKIGTQCVHVSAIWKLLLDMLFCLTLYKMLRFVGFVWCHVCFAALKINETVEKKN